MNDEMNFATEAAAHIPSVAVAVPDMEEVSKEINQDIPVVDIEEKPTEESNIITLSQSVEINGVKTDKVEVNMNKLTGSALKKAERLFRTRIPEKEAPENIFNSMTYWMILVSMVTGFEYKDFEALPGMVALEITGEVRSRFFTV